MGLVCVLLLKRPYSSLVVMMRSNSSSVFLGLFASALSALPLGAAPATNALKPGERARWDMDYGPFLNLTVQMPGETAGSTPKGVAIRVGESKEGTVAFDTDLMRCTGGWTGGFLDFKGVAFNGAHGGNPGPVGEVVFQTSAVPGWSKAGSFADPRALPRGFGASTIPYGPLPADWAKYKGLYRHGEKTVLSYTVGTAAVLEAPGLEGSGEGKVLTRTFNVRSAGAASTLLVAEVSPSAQWQEREGCLVVTEGAEKEDARLVLKVLGAPASAKWVWIAPGRVGLELPAFAGGERWKVGHWRGKERNLSEAFAALGAMNPAQDLAPWTRPGPALWPEVISVKGEVGSEDGPFQLDTVSLPMQNPWNSWLRLGGLDFFQDGRIAFSTLAGDVWVGKGVDDGLQNIQWKRFAAGLHQPLG
ncbi:MAG: hypothetical protein RLZZ399_522, partial [Verrucomicrobiota bacterium]